MRASHQAWVDTSMVMTDFVLPSLSLTSPRAWLESLPPGAYTVLRCDHFGGVESSTKIWGRDFHIQRLETSIQTLAALDDKEPFSARIICTKDAIQQTDQIIKALLSCCEDQDHFLCDSYMVTILWFLQDKTLICVRGHMTPYQTDWNPKEYNPHSIKAILAYDPESALPSRKEHHPEAKLSSWCQVRKPLETKFKVPYQVDEVFLLDDSNFDAVTKRGSNRTALPANVRILEGLTSNIFVVHQDGTLYTAPDHSVLGGYARQLVMESAIRLDMIVNSSLPVYLKEASLWTEVFVTSAIKLVTPVDSVLVPEDDNGTHPSTLLWSQPVSENKQHVWEAIYMDILSHNLMK